MLCYKETKKKKKQKNVQIQNLQWSPPFLAQYEAAWPFAIA